MLRVKFLVYRSYMAIDFGVRVVFQNFDWWKTCMSHEECPSCLMERFWERLNLHSKVVEAKYEADD
jgi:hypothetical protein